MSTEQERSRRKQDTSSVSFSAKIKTLLSDLLLLIQEGEKNIPKLELLAEQYPNPRDFVITRILQIDNFRTLVNSPKAVKQLIEAFPEHENGIFLLISNKATFKALARTPQLIQSLIDCFPKSYEFEKVIVEQLLDLETIQILIVQDIQNVVALADIFKNNKDTLAELILDKEILHNWADNDNDMATLRRIFPDQTKLLDRRLFEIKQTPSFQNANTFFKAPQSSEQVEENFPIKGPESL